MKSKAKLQKEVSQSAVSDKPNSKNDVVRKSSNEKDVQKIALISIKYSPFLISRFQNVLKEKFSTVDLVAEENFNKILEDLKFLMDTKIQVDVLGKTGVCKALHKFQRY